MTCPRCATRGWVCERHPARPFESAVCAALGCSAPGAPCPDCNPYAASEEARLLVSVEDAALRLTGHTIAPQRPVRREHEPGGNCWCRPHLEAVRRGDGSLGTVAVHQGAGDPVGRALAAFVAMEQVRRETADDYREVA